MTHSELIRCLSYLLYRVARPFLKFLYISVSISLDAITLFVDLGAVFARRQVTKWPFGTNLLLNQELLCVHVSTTFRVVLEEMDHLLDCERWMVNLSLCLRVTTRLAGVYYRRRKPVPREDGTMVQKYVCYIA